MMALLVPSFDERANAMLMLLSMLDRQRHAFGHELVERI
jgi:hypothetical protein